MHGSLSVTTGFRTSYIRHQASMLLNICKNQYIFTYYYYYYYCYYYYYHYYYYYIHIYIYIERERERGGKRGGKRKRESQKALREWFDFVSLFNSISNFMDYLIPKPSLQKSSIDTFEPIAGKIRGLIDICRKVNLIAQLEFEPL